MSIIKVNKKRNPYAQIDRSCLEDDRLSWKATGILAYLLSKPNQWTVRIKDIEKHGKDGEKAIRAGLKELINAGYAELKTIQNTDGKLAGKTYIIHEIPLKQTETTKKAVSEEKKNTDMTILGVSQNRKVLKSEFPKKAIYSNKDSLIIKTNSNIEREGEEKIKNQTTPPPTVSNSFQEEKLGKTSSEIPTSPLGKERLQRKKVATKKESTAGVHLSLSKRTKLSFEELFNTTHGLNNFTSLLSDLKDKVDVHYYYEKISLHATSKSLQKTIKEWKAYIQKWIFEDKENGKLKLAPIQADNKPQTSPLENKELIQQKIERQAKLMDIEYAPENAESIKEEFRILWKDATAVQQTDIKYIIDHLKIKETDKLKTAS